MTLYTRHQLIVLLTLLGAAGLGLAVGHWRRGNPDVVDRLETLDRSAPAVSPVVRPPTPPAPPPRELRTTGRRTQKSVEVPIDLNRATPDELARLPGVGRAMAARIVAAREAAGPFATVDDLRHVRGLGRSRIDRLRSLVTAAP